MLTGRTKDKTAGNTSIIHLFSAKNGFLEKRTSRSALKNFTET